MTKAGRAVNDVRHMRRTIGAVDYPVSESIPVRVARARAVRAAADQRGLGKHTVRWPSNGWPVRTWGPWGERDGEIVESHVGPLVVPPQDQASPWSPISSAPTDGTWILAKGPGTRPISVQYKFTELHLSGWIEMP